MEVLQLKIAKGANKNVVATRSHNEYKDALLNRKCLRHSMNRIQSKDHKIETYEINKISLPCFDEKINTHPKQWIRWISSWLLELIIKKQLS